MMIKTLAAALGVAALLSCGDTTQTQTTQLAFDRPVDVAFACYGGLRLTQGMPRTDPPQEVTNSAQPLTSCEFRAQEQDHNVDSTHPATVFRPPGQEDVDGQPVGDANFYAFVLQTLRGTVQLVKFDTSAASSYGTGTNSSIIGVADGDPLTPGVNAISVGEEPIAIATDNSGCFEVTANAGSCDVSQIEVKGVVDGDPMTPVVVNRATIKNAAGQPILARPAAMLSQPSDAVIGNACPAQPTGLFYIAYPSCHLVAGVDMATGTIVTGVQYSAAGVPSIVTGNVTCPSDCGAPGGAAPSDGPRPVSIHLEYDQRVQTRRMVIGSDNSASVTIVELDTASKPTSLSQIAFENPNGTLGFTAVTMSPQIGMGGSDGFVEDDSSPGGQGQYVYGVANDGTVRVADVLSLRTECDTQVDPRYVRNVANTHTVSCFANGAPTTPPRRPGAKGPGIDFIGDAKPLSVEIFRSDQYQFNASTPPTGVKKLAGYFAVVTTTSGSLFIVNVDDDSYPDLFDKTSPQATAVPLVIAHQLRDGLDNRGQIPLRQTPDPTDVTKTIDWPDCKAAAVDPDTNGSNSGPPRALTLPTRNAPAGVISANKVPELPSIRQVHCTSPDEPTVPNTAQDVAVSETDFNADPIAVRDVEFPDLRGMRSDETWTMTWQGVLSRDTSTSAIDGPPIRDGQVLIDGAGMRIVDQSRPYCAMGVEHFDIVQLRGCDPSVGDTDCPNGYTCFVHPQSQISGLGTCMLADEADRLAVACKDFLTSMQRYTVGRSDAGQLILRPRKHVLRTTPIDGCSSDAQCKDLADYALKNLNDADPIHDNTMSDPHTYSCMADTERPNVNANPAQNKRCVETCTTTADCTAGTVCENNICMESVVPSQVCVNGPMRYEVRANEAFTVIGSRSGYIHQMIEQNGACVRDPAAHPWTVGRIPLAPPACDPTADPFTGKNAAGVLEPNPCSLTLQQFDAPTPQVVNGACQAAATTDAPVGRTANAIKFRNRAMTINIVDPTYPGDASCNVDRGGTRTNVPLVFDDYQISTRITAGFFAMVLPVTPTLPVKVVRGPTESIWVMDAGDFLSTSVNQASTRGQVYRIEPGSLAVTAIDQSQ